MFKAPSTYRVTGLLVALLLVFVSATPGHSLCALSGVGCAEHMEAGAKGGGDASDDARTSCCDLSSFGSAVNSTDDKAAHQGHPTDEATDCENGVCETHDREKDCEHCGCEYWASDSSPSDKLLRGASVSVVDLPALPLHHIKKPLRPESFWALLPEEPAPQPVEPVYLLLQVFLN